MYNTNNLNIDAIALTSNDILQELICQSLERIIGGTHTIITQDLPVGGHHLLAIDAEHCPVLVSYDPCDGGRVLLAALSALEHLKDNRGWLFKLYPSLFEKSAHGHQALRIEDMRVVLVSPEKPPGYSLLAKLMPQLKLFTFQAISINGDIGLLLSEVLQNEHRDNIVELDNTEGLPPFRQGHQLLNNQEEAYFRALGQ